MLPPKKEMNKKKELKTRASNILKNYNTVKMKTRAIQREEKKEMLIELLSVNALVSYRLIWDYLENISLTDRKTLRKKISDLK